MGHRCVSHRHALARVRPALCIRLPVARGRFCVHGRFCVRGEFRVFGNFSKILFSEISEDFVCGGLFLFSASVVRLCSPFPSDMRLGGSRGPSPMHVLPCTLCAFPFCICMYESNYGPAASLEPSSIRAALLSVMPAQRQEFRIGFCFAFCVHSYFACACSHVCKLHCVALIISLQPYGCCTPYTHLMYRYRSLSHTHTTPNTSADFDLCVCVCVCVCVCPSRIPH